MSKRFMESMLCESWQKDTPGEEIEGEVYTITSKQIRDDHVPMCEILLDDGSIVSVLMSNFALQQIWTHSAFTVGGYIAIRYDGEAKSISKAGNHAKLFSCWYCKPGDWKRNENGEVVGTPTSLKRTDSNDHSGDPPDNPVILPSIGESQVKV